MKNDIKNENEKSSKINKLKPTRTIEDYYEDQNIKEKSIKLKSNP